MVYAFHLRRMLGSTHKQARICALTRSPSQPATHTRILTDKYTNTSTPTHPRTLTRTQAVLRPGVAALQRRVCQGPSGPCAPLGGPLLRSAPHSRRNGASNGNVWERKMMRVMLPFPDFVHWIHAFAPCAFSTPLRPPKKIRTRPRRTHLP